MGIRAEFWRGAPDGILGHFLNSPLADFQAWYQQGLSDFPEDVDADLLPLIVRVVEQGASALQAHTAKEAVQVDRMMDAFYGGCGFEESVEPHLLVEADGCALNVGRYDDTEAFVRRYLGAEAHHLWNHLLNGRGTGRPDGVYPYRSKDGVSRLSFWTYDEVALFRQRLLDYGTVAAIPKQAEDAYAVLSVASNAIDNVYADGLGLIITVS